MRFHLLFVARMYLPYGSVYRYVLNLQGMTRTKVSTDTTRTEPVTVKRKKHEKESIYYITSEKKRETRNRLTDLMLVATLPETWLPQCEFDIAVLLWNSDHTVDQAFPLGCRNPPRQLEVKAAAELAEEALLLWWLWWIRPLSASLLVSKAHGRGQWIS
jgi:hypothetical protein